MTPIVRSGAAARSGAVLLVIGPLVSWVAGVGVSCVEIFQGSNTNVANGLPAPQAAGGRRGGGRPGDR
ncbi:hypothetical protein ACIA5G_45560 [Amycolatopsis sp. NPDC051758]|uniref:hypothetical protein n=1 Tax=Amycolatopsis sp. NPDC051758 TaxID=3363935 RepID=UPI00379DF8FF